MQSQQAKTQAQQKQEFLNIIELQKKDIKKSREIISSLLDKLNEEVENLPQNSDINAPLQSAQKFLWGDKESATSIITKLTTILLKLLPMEQKLYQIDLDKATSAELEKATEDLKIETEDLEILQRYKDKILSEKSNF